MEGMTMNGTQTKMQNIHALAAGLSQDNGIHLHVGDHWSFDPHRRIIEVDRTHVEENAELSHGLLAHEVGHAWISRYHLFSPGELSRPVWSSFMNAIEDPRVNLWVQRRYPGTVPWFESMYAFDRTAPVTTPSRFLRWGAAVSVADAYGWTEIPAWIEGEARVREAFVETMEARRRYARRLPSPDLSGRHTDKSLDSTLRHEVVPLLAKGVAIGRIDRAEKLVVLSAARATVLAADEILPAARRLIEEDEKAIASFLGRQPELAEFVDHGVKQNRPQVLDVIGEALGAPPGPSGDHEIKLARRAFAQYVAKNNGSRDMVSDAPPGAVRNAEERRLIGGDGRRNRGRLDAGALSSAVRRQLPALVRDMEEVLEPRRRRRPRAGFATGRRVDLRRLMRFEADRRDYDRLWVRHAEPGRAQASVTLLVDLSGSMQGSKIEAATMGTLLLAETLDRLAPAVRYAVTGFQDELIPFKDFDAPLSRTARDAILEMPMEAYGDRPRGHNQPRYNDDGPCLAEAADRLLRQPGQRILFVVSDGRPAGRHSGDAELRDTIGRLSGGAAPLTLFGLGLGAKTDHVTEFYPNAVANIPVDAFAAHIGGLLKRVLGGP
jgi:hypothetical protein